ncbi:MAG: glycosyltransferase [Candidatus Thorarchaeota archaeon]
MRKKIMILVPSLKFGGGAEKVASILSLNLAKNYEVAILTLYHFENIYPFKGTYYTIQEKHFLRGIFVRFFKMKKMIKSISPDIIITFMNKTSFWIIPIKYLCNIQAPLIINVNTNPDFHYRKRIYGKYLIKFLYPLEKVNIIVPVSNELKKILVNNYKLEGSKINPIYTGFNIERIQKLAKEKLGDYDHNNIFEDSGVIKFITIGRLSREKGHIYLIKAFSQVSKKINNSKLFIIGEGPLREKLKKLVKEYNLEKNVILLGKKKNPYKYISKADIFVLSSLHEGLPTVLIEALACNIPIISTNCETGPKEILANGKYGILTKIADSSDLANKMIFLAENEEVREKLSQNSNERIKIFEERIFINNWIKLINKLSNKT